MGQLTERSQRKKAGSPVASSRTASKPTTFSYLFSLFLGSMKRPAKNSPWTSKTRYVRNKDRRWQRWLEQSATWNVPPEPRKVFAKFSKLLLNWPQKRSTKHQIRFVVACKLLRETGAFSLPVLSQV